MAKDNGKHIFNVPNMLSVVRILLIPVFVLLLVKDRMFSAFVVFVLAALTDLLDGIAARIWDQKTTAGTYLDPAADKLLMASAFIALSLPRLSSPNSIPFWLVFVVIFRDIYIVSGSLVYLKLTGQTKLRPSLPGKACTVLEMGLLVLVLFFNALDRPLSYLPVLSIVVLAIVLLSAADYTATGISGLRNLRGNKRRGM